MKGTKNEQKPTRKHGVIEDWLFCMYTKIVHHVHAYGGEKIEDKDMF